jgi:hypothetical protein
MWHGRVLVQRSLRFATQVGTEEPTHQDSVIVFHASDWDAALERAIDLGYCGADQVDRAEASR